MGPFSEDLTDDQGYNLHIPSKSTRVFTDCIKLGKLPFYSELSVNTTVEERFKRQVNAFHRFCSLFFCFCAGVLDSVAAIFHIAKLNRRFRRRSHLAIAIQRFFFR